MAAPGVPIGLPADLPAPLLQLEWCAPFTGVTRRALHALKYDGERRLAPPLGAARRAPLGSRRRGWRRARAVPASPDRVRERGYDQAALLAAEAGRRLGLPVSHAVERTRATTAQFDLDRAGRAANLGWGVPRGRWSSDRGRRSLGRSWSTTSSRRAPPSRPARSRFSKPGRRGSRDGGRPRALSRTFGGPPGRGPAVRWTPAGRSTCGRSSRARTTRFRRRSATTRRGSWAGSSASSMTAPTRRSSSRSSSIGAPRTPTSSTSPWSSMGRRCAARRPRQPHKAGIDAVVDKIERRAVDHRETSRVRKSSETGSGRWRRAGARHRRGGRTAGRRSSRSSASTSSRCSRRTRSPGWRSSATRSSCS